MKRVVVTGIGAVTPLGNTAREFWDGIRAGKNGIGPITAFDCTEHKAKMAAEVKNFDPDRYLDKKEQRRMDRFCQFGMAAAVQAYEDSGVGKTVEPEDFAVITGSGIGGLATLESNHTKLLERGPSRVSALMIPMIIGNILAGDIAIRYGLKGETRCIVTACSSGTDAIGDAFRLIREGRATAAVAGAAEATITPLSIAAFSNMTALSTRTDPDFCSTPFDKSRDGFVMGEGAGMLILEEYEHARARGAHVYGEVMGYGASCDAYHFTSPDPEGAGAALAMRRALADAGLAPEDVSYLNAHGTGTPANDRFETVAIKRVFGEAAYRIPVSSTKSMTGHMLGAAGAVESIVCLKAIGDSFIPATVNLREPDEGLDLDYVPGAGREAPVRYALSNSLGFGGHNGTLIFGRVDG